MRAVTVQMDTSKVELLVAKLALSVKSEAMQLEMTRLMLAV